MADSYTLIKPFTAVVNASGNAFVDVTHSIHGLAWQVMQVGLGLGQAAPSPQCAALVNGIPFVSSVLMAPSVFASFGSAPIAMTSEFSGVPFPTLEAGDVMKVGVQGAIVGDIFTVGVFINEILSPSAISAARGSPPGYTRRPGTRRWG